MGHLTWHGHRLRGLESLPFEPGEKIAVKVLDHCGNEMLHVLELTAQKAQA